MPVNKRRRSTVTRQRLGVKDTVLARMVPNLRMRHAPRGAHALYTQTMSARKQARLLAQGSHAPSFHLKLLDGGDAKLEEILARGPAVLAFFKVSCPVCQLTFPFLERIHAAGGLPVYGVSQNDAKDTRGFNQDFGVTFPTLLDAEKQGFPASNAYGISSVPTLFRIEPDGTVSHVIEGWNKKEMESLGDKAGAGVFRQGENVPEWKAG